jgi:mRNA-degrading endonuclease HigB of HigAB toxin-antitoxin module
MKKLWTRPKQMQGSVGEDSDRTDDEPLIIDAEGNITESESNRPKTRRKRTA